MRHRVLLRSISVLLAAALTIALTGCETLEGGQSFNLLSTEQEVELGKQVSAEVEKQEKMLDDAAIQAYVGQIGQRLARVSSRQDIAYTFKVFDAPDTVNAFALPGGNMYIYTGLMKICQNEAELAAVMAHEMGHVAARHHGESMTRQYGYNLIASLLLGDNPKAAAQLAAGLIGQTITARYSREQEREADALGMEFMFRAGYSPDAMISFMQKLQAEESKGGGQWLPIFASHPPTTERLQLLGAMLQRYPAELRRQSPTYPERYQQQVLARLS